MPLYEYRCQSCEHTFQRIEKASAMPATPPDCPECGGSARRQLGVPALQFKGTGWYVTDYAKKKGSPSGPAKGAGSSDSGSGSDSGSSSSKPDSSSDTSSGSSSSSSSGETKSSAA